MKTNKQNILISLLLVSLSIIILQTSTISAATSTVCAEHTIYGAWCQDVPMSQVDTNYPYSSGTACASTSYCQTGTCVNTAAGTCLQSPQATCTSSAGGQWYSTSPTNTPVCQLGCCQFGEQASFTTKAACFELSSLYGQNATFDSSISNEPSCLETAFPQSKGACVFDSGNGRTCQFTTRQTCNSMNNVKATFYENFLCTNPSLQTNCVPTQKTTCLSTSDQVFFTDSCGNQANIYDASRASDTNYWSYIAGTNGVTVNTGDGKGNIESTSNGNCNYFYGSTCMSYNASIDGNNVPQMGNNICRNINCFSTSDPYVSLFQNKYGRTPVNGESWCGMETSTSVKLEQYGNPGITVSGSSADSISINKNGNVPGGTEVLFICQNGQVTTQIGANYRNQVCLQNITSNGYYSAAFVANRWQDCYYQNNSQDCLDTNSRDCVWLTGLSISKSDNGVPTGSNACVPKFSPGFDPSSGENSTCNLASLACYTQFTKNGWQQIFGGQSSGSSSSDCLDSNENLNQNWANSVANFGSAIGDCGLGINYIGTNGANTQNSVFTVTTSGSYSSSS